MKKIIRNVSDKIIRVVLYIRVSTEEQAKHGYSIESQLNRLKEYCKEQGYKIVAIYIDEGKTARTKLKNRKELLQLVEDAKLDKFDRVIVWRLDRWFRNVADYYEVQRVLEAHNVDWECSDEEYDTYTSNGRLYLNVKLSIAQNESDQTGDRIKFNFGNMIKNKRPIYGSQCLPLGLIVKGDKKDKRVVIDEDTKGIVYDMFDKIEMTGSIRKTLSYINKKYNLSIHYDSMRKYLRNSLYYGFYKGVYNYCEAYISEERYMKIQDLIRNNNKDNKKQYDYIFTGLVKCKDCGTLMSGCTHRSIHKNKDGTKRVYKSAYYRCNKCWGSQICTNKKLANQNKLEKWVLEHFENELKNYIITLKALNDKPVNNVKYSLKNRDKLLSKLDRLNELYIDGKITKEKYDKDYNQYKKEIDIIENHKEELRDISKYENMLDSFNGMDIYNKLDDVHKNLFWKRYIEYIEQDEESLYKIIFK